MQKNSLKKVYSFQDIPNGYVDVNIYGKQRFSLWRQAKAGKIPAVHFFTKEGNIKGRMYVDKSPADIIANNLRNGKKKENKEPEELRKFTVTQLMGKIEKMDAKLDKIMKEFEIR